jgi:hypothetical protein
VQSHQQAMIRAAGHAALADNTASHTFKVGKGMHLAGLPRP